ncbi:hypothetical protein IQ13_4186 [Lacibacter cauensis]|uniref:Uncharacterized protein n=1 Tax=Lacibacter cauensis TaxID=510947 RepID=A0A562SAP9_9BACT|nr:hypothetical protein [Lacibacter cauensis]TWI77944.1 hypothetical protein IQ13_4186 [Lacibacter cauensis]
MIDINTLVGLLSGSLATLIIKEAINVFNKQQDFNRELKKITYLKKLEKAENAIAFYWTYLNRVTEMKKSFEVLIKAINELDENDYDVEIILEVINNTSQRLAELSSDKYSSINAIHLYFDLDDNDKWNENDIESLLKSLAEIKSIDNEINFWMDLHNNANNANDTPKADIYWNNAIGLFPTYVKSLQSFIDTIEKNKKASYAVVHSIKKQLKRY